MTDLSPVLGCTCMLSPQSTTVQPNLNTGLSLTAVSLELAVSLSPSASEFTC
jgi:hypothetical protein